MLERMRIYCCYHDFISFSAAQILDLLYVLLHSSPSTGILLTMLPAPSWPDSSVGRALHRYRRGHRFDSRSGLNTLASLDQFKTIRIGEN